MRYCCVLCCLCLSFGALLVSSQTQAAPFCFAGLPMTQVSGLKLGADSTVFTSLPLSHHEQRFLHLLLPESEADTRRARQAVTSSLKAGHHGFEWHSQAFDRYQRPLGHLTTQQTWLQKAWVTQGAFRVLPGMVASKVGAEQELACLAALFQAEMDAVAARRGLWSEAGHVLLAAQDIEALEKHVANFVLVEGRVQGVGRAGARHFINFGEDWRSDFTVVVPQSVLAAWPQDLHHPGFLQGQVLSALIGQKLRVRGWLTSYRGPEVIIDDLSQLEVVSASSGEALEKLAPVGIKGMAEDLP